MGREEAGSWGVVRRPQKKRGGTKKKKKKVRGVSPLSQITSPLPPVHTAPSFLKAAAVAATLAAAYNPNNPARSEPVSYPEINYPAAGGGGGGYAPAPPARREPFLTRLSSGGKRLALSAIVGFFAGKVFQKVTATVFYGIVGLMLVTQYLAFKGTLNVRWGGIFSKAARFLDLDGDGSFGLGDLKAAGWGGASLVARFVPSASGFVAGFAYGVLG